MTLCYSNIFTELLAAAISVSLSPIRQWFTAPLCLQDGRGCATDSLDSHNIVVQVL